MAPSHVATYRLSVLWHNSHLSRGFKARLFSCGQFLTVSLMTPRVRYTDHQSEILTVTTVTIRVRLRAHMRCHHPGVDQSKIGSFWVRGIRPSVPKRHSKMYSRARYLAVGGTRWLVSQDPGDGSAPMNLSNVMERVLCHISIFQHIFLSLQYLTQDVCKEFYRVMPCNAYWCATVLP